MRLKRVYEPIAPEDGVRILVDRRWPRGLDKANATIDRWEKEIAPSTALQRWFGGRRARWAEFRIQYALELDAAGENLARLGALAKDRRLTLLSAARDLDHRGAAVLRDILLSDEVPDARVAKIVAHPLSEERSPPPMNHSELIRFLNSALASSRSAVREAKAIVKDAATQVLDIQRDEAYACAILIRLIKSLGGRPSPAMEVPEGASRVAGLAPRLALFVMDRIRMQDELRSNLLRINDDRVRLRLLKLLTTQSRNIRRLNGNRYLALAQPRLPRLG